jgi:lantibiotic modifying enzyme
MMAAWHLWQKTGDERWRRLFSDNIEQLWQTWLPVSAKEFYMWTQDLYGHTVQLLGAGHGFVGNVYPLLRGAALLDSARREELYERCAKTLRVTCALENGEANWPQGIGTPRPGRTHKLMQWCHGAPGVITALAASYPSGRSLEIDALLVAGGEAIWAAGPLLKGYGLCHGTAGNGYALLKLYKRTGNPLWLDRARAFAMHAIAQRKAMQSKFGHGRYSLWTGELGLAVYLWDCLVGVDTLPTLDIID